MIIRKIIQGRNDLKEIYDQYPLLVEASMPYFRESVVERLNEIRYIDTPLYYHPDLDPRHYGAVFAAYVGLHEIPFGELPNIKELYMAERFLDVIPPCIKTIKMGKNIPLYRDNFSATHFIVRSAHIRAHIPGYEGVIRAGDIFGENIKHLEVVGKNARRVMWDSIEHDGHIRSGPITPDTIIRCAYFTNNTFIELDVTPLGGMDQANLLTWKREYECFDVCATIYVSRLRKDGTFIPSLYYDANGVFIIDYSRVESKSIAKINIEVNNITNIHVMLPRDCTSMHSIDIETSRAEVEITHPDAIRYNGLKYPWLNHCFVDYHLRVME